MSENNGPNVPPPPQYPPRYRNQRGGGSRWWIPVVIVLGVFFLFFGILVAGIGYFASQISELDFEGSGEIVKVKENSVLYLDLENGVPEYTQRKPFESFGKKKKPESLFNVLSAIGRAKDDDDIIGIYLRPKGSLPMSRAIEINEALLEFKESGKFVYAFIEAGNESTYLSALPADSIFMPTEGMLELNGYSITSMFFKNMAKKIGVEFTTIGWEDFKSAGDMMSKTSYSDSSEYQLRVMLNQSYQQFLDQIYEHRGISRSESHYIMSKGIYTSEKAFQNKFVDGIMTEYDLKRMIKNEFYPADSVESTIPDSKINLISAGSYLGSNPKIKGEVGDPDKQIAIIYATGEIASGYANSSPFRGSEQGIYSDTFIEHLRKARNDDKIKLIILRIDSPGGSAIASDEMWEEIQLTRKVKPVWASMSSVAASGGYYMSMACDKIYAHPNTVTGSIGVILAIPNMSETADMLGVTFDTLQTTPSAQFLNGAYKYQSDDLAQLKDISWGIYKRFVQRAADSRGFSFDEMRSKAKGRVWTGKDALEQGLVDDLGGFDDVINDAKAELGIDEDKLVYVDQYPKTAESFNEFLDQLFNPEENPEADASNVKIAELLGLDPLNVASQLTNMPDDYKNQLEYMLKLSEMSKNEKVLMALPQVPTIK
jgi:protease-4